MNTKFKKLALSAGIAAALGGFSMPSHAIIEGVAGEALLVPFAIYDDGTNDSTALVNTIVEITVPGSVGLDTIPNNFTASHSTPTGTAMTFNNPNLNVQKWTTAGTSGIHWYFFDQESLHQANGTIPVTADDLVLFDWGQQVRSGGNALNQVPGYLVFGTEKARLQDGAIPGSHAAADFSFFGDAYLVTTSKSLPEFLGIVDAKLPVLPMNDGADAPGQTKVTVDNQVLYRSNLVFDVSPLVSGMRTVWSDGVPNITVFDLSLGERQYPTLHVFWNDDNRLYTADADVFDDAENSCSSPIPLPWEVNVIWISPSDQWGLAPPWKNLNTTQLCYPNGINHDLHHPGFVRYQIPEQGDTNIGVPEQAAVAFSILWQHTHTRGILDTVPVETSLGHERGKFY